MLPFTCQAMTLKLMAATFSFSIIHQKLGRKRRVLTTLADLFHAASSHRSAFGSAGNVDAAIER